MSYKFSILLLPFLLVNLNLNAQNYIFKDKLVEPDAIEAQHLQRVGSAPIPEKSYLNFSPEESNVNVQTKKSNKMTKNIYETTDVSGRIIYLNGENISSIRNQQLEKVNLEIDKNGNINIHAPQYEVSSEQSYHPLLPKELPTFKKTNNFENTPLPYGVYSKDSGTPVSKEMAPEMNSKTVIPAIK